MYLMMDDTTSYVETASTLEEHYLKVLEGNPTGSGLPRSPHRFLLDYYEYSGQYQKGIDLLRDAQRYMNDASLDQYIRMFERMMTEGADPPPADTADMLIP